MHASRTSGRRSPTAVYTVPRYAFDTAVRFGAGPADAFVYTDISRQTLSLCAGGRAVRAYPVSTARLGTGNREGSMQTPRGTHRIAVMIGRGASSGRIFRRREDSGTDWDGSANGDDLILTRIMRLEGLEDGVNRGPGIDSFDRFIYIHGTNHEESVGTPASHGCIRMTNADVIDLFDRVREGTLVIID